MSRNGGRADPTGGNLAPAHAYMASRVCDPLVYLGPPVYPGREALRSSLVSGSSPSLAPEP